MFDSVKKSVKGRVPAGWRGPGAFGTEWVGIGLLSVVHAKFTVSDSSLRPRSSLRLTQRSKIEDGN